MCWRKSIIRTSHGEFSPAIRFSFHPPAGPDLLGEKHTKKLAEKQFHTLRDFYLKMPDHVMIYPNHGAGSPCGADIGARLSSTIGYERKFNKFLQFADVKSVHRLRAKDRAAGSALLPGDEETERERTGDSRGIFRAFRVFRQKHLRKRLRRKAGVLVDVRTNARVWRRSYSRRAQHWRVSDAFDLGGLDARPDEPILLVLENDDDLERSCGFSCAPVTPNSPAISSAE